MNLHHLLAKRHAAGKPVRVALIGAGKFGSMFLSQVPHTPGLEVPVIVDLDPERAREACRTVGWDDARIAATKFTDDGAAATAGNIDVIVEATGNPAVGIKHARAAIAAGKHIVMVNVEADVLAGPLLAEEARQAGVVYSLAYGDQPALTAEMVDWARATGFRVVAAGKGTKYLPAYHDVTPAGVWSHYGLTAGEAQSAGMNPQMFNSFLDGTKSAIEMAAIANATGLDVPVGRAVVSALRRRRPAACDASARQRAACWKNPAWSKWCRRWSATAGRCFAICAGASMWCWKRRTITPRTVSGNTA